MMLRYQVEDMSCGHCVNTITQALTALDPTAEVAVDLPTKTVDVTTRADGDTVAGAIRQAGYTPVAAPDAASASPGRSCCGHC